MRTHKVKVEDFPKEFSQARDLIYTELVKIIESKKIGTLFDTILLDEGQDYLPRELELFRSITDHLFVVADSKQKIYDGEDSLTTAIKLVDEVKNLTHHYRNGHRICEVADEIGKRVSDYQPMFSTSNYKENEYKSEAKLVSCQDLKQEVDFLLSKLEAQLKAYPDANLGVLCPTNKDIDVLWNEISGKEIAELFSKKTDDGVLIFSDDKRIYLCTVHSAKGLEFRAVHIFRSESFKKFRNNRYELTYVAVTRAKTSLTTYHVAPIEGFFESAMRKADPIVDEPTMDDIFGIKK